MKKGKQISKEPKQQKNYLYLAYKGKEYLWLAFTIISIGIAIYLLITGAAQEEVIYFIGLTILSGLFYSFNRYRRIKWEKREAEEAELKN
jgi:uncharacterized membrane protein